MKVPLKIVRVTLAVLVLGYLGCGERGRPGVIKIVSSLPRTGSAKKQSDTMVNAIRMALEEAGWKVGDFKLEYDDLDDATASAGQWTAEAETANADKAVQDADVMVYIGTLNSGAAKVSMPKLNRARLAMISPANTATGLTKPGKGAPGEPGIYRPSGKLNFCRVVPADDIQGPLSADFAKSQGIKKVYVLDDNEIYGKGIADLFDARCQEIGVEVLGHESIDAKAQEFKSLMTKIKAKNPDLVYFGGTTQSKGGQVAKDMMAVGLNCKIMVPDGCFEQVLIDSAGAENLNDRCWVTFGGLPPSQLTGPGKVFVDNYLKKYGNMPEAYATYAYECAKVALDAIAKTGKKDREAITQTVLATRDFDKGALPKWSFDENGDTTLKTMSVNIVRDGKFEFLDKMGE
jgi:branched-chain amino acid transport system substrate-binding protein